MKNVSTALNTYLLTGNSYQKADLYAFDLRDGTALRWTDGASDLLEYSAAGPTIKRGSIRSTAGAEVNTLEMTLGVGEGTALFGVPMQLAAAQGVFDGAKVRVNRLFMPTWGDDSLGLLPLFTGWVSEVKPSSTEIKITVRDGKERLNRKEPHNLYQPSCGYSLYDAGCGVTKNTVAAVVQAGSTVNSIVVNRSDATDYWKLGSIRFTSGMCTGIARNILASSGGTLSLDVNLPVAPTQNTTVELLTGCDKSPGANGCARYNNLPRFRGFPFVPKPESIR